MENQKNKFTKLNKSIITNCKNCWSPIYQGEVFYNVDLKQNSDYQVDYHFGTSIGDGYNQGNWSIAEVWIQCGWCYWQWQEELRKSKVPLPPPPPPPVPFNWWGWGMLININISGTAFWFFGLKHGDLLTGAGITAAIFLSITVLIWIILKKIFKSKPLEPVLPPQSPILVNRFKLRRREQNE